MSLSAVPSPTYEPERSRVLTAVPEPFPGQDDCSAPQSDRCPADWRRPDAYWSCVRHAGHRGRHRMRGGSHAA